jgi:hypothetical protein
MSVSKPYTTPIDAQAKVASDMGAHVINLTVYHSVVKALQYLIFTRPGITYVVQQVCLHMHGTREPHLMVVKRILRYLQGTLHHGLLLRHASTSELIYTDNDWTGCPDTRRSTSSYAVFLGDNLISWSLKR